MKHIGLLIMFVCLISGMVACETNGIQPLTTLRTDELELWFEYEGLSFKEDGIGQVELYRCIDGDTARFTEDGGITHYSVRFQGIDTPETGRNEEPWAEAASRFVCDVLTNAEIIVLEWDDSSTRFETYGRYLGFVWYDGRLLNLELVELAYTPSMAIRTKYGELMFDAWMDAMATRRRIHGERDPNFNYND